MSKRKTWGDVVKGDRIEVAGRTWLVTKAKLKGKRVHAVVERGGDIRDAMVDAAGAVKVLKREAPEGVNGREARWATKSEHAEALPPSEPRGGDWTAPKGKAETVLADRLSARLVGESHDGGETYYVPPVDVSTVAAHLVIFHEYLPPHDEGEGSMLEHHAQLHAAGGAGRPWHWHTAERP